MFTLENIWHWLLLSKAIAQDMPKSIAFSLTDYCELVGITGRIIRSDKAGHIDHQQHPILQRLGLSDEQWLTLTTRLGEK